MMIIIQQFIEPHLMEEHQSLY